MSKKISRNLEENLKEIRYLINVESGKEEQILQLIHDEKGTLTF